MRAIAKLLANMGPAAARALGPGQYLRYVGAVLLSLPKILRQRDLRPVDQRMGRRPVRVRFRGRRFVIDCPAADAQVNDGTFAFGIVREMFIRNCYVRQGIERAIDAAQTVLDLGSNRGIFSVMAAASARKVVAVEVLPSCIRAIEANIAANRLGNVAVENVFISRGGSCAGQATTSITMAELLARHRLDRVDLVKMDIEGSEFELFREPGWLGRVGAVCMEVHPEFGRVQNILDALEKEGFGCVAGDTSFRMVADPQAAAFIWAVHPGRVGAGGGG